MLQNIAIIIQKHHEVYCNTIENTIHYFIEFLYYLHNFWRTLEIPLINCEINLILTWSANYILSNATANQNTTFATTDTKFYVPVVTSSIDDNAKLLQQLKSRFKPTINWNKYEPKIATQNVANQYFTFSIDPSFQRVNRLCFKI